MISIRKSWLAALTLTAFVGCNNAETPPATSPTTEPATTTPATVTPTPDAPKDGMKAEMAKPDEPKAEEPKIEAPKVEAPKVEAPKDESKTEAPKTADAKLSAEEVAEIKKLPADQQDLALKQVVCPVSGHHLGSMEAPIKVNAEGKTFFLCCAACQKELKADPKAVVAKLIP